MIFLRGLVRVSLRLLTRFEVHGTEKFPQTGTAMYVMNHLHWSDPVIGMAIVSRPAYTFVADKWEHRRHCDRQHGAAVRLRFGQ